MYSSESNSPIVTIILPLFNAENYILETLISVQNQTYKKIEVIILDDGSTDRSKEICEKFIASDDRFKLYSKCNEGISRTRNMAINMAKGLYIAFCDHDDLMDRNLINELLEIIMKNDADIAFSNYSIEYFDKNRKCVKKSHAGIEDNTYSKQDIFQGFPFIRRNLQSVWNGLYKKQIFLINNIYFDETMKFGGEDITINYQLIPVVNKIVTTKKILYYHFKRSGQSTSALLNKNRIDALIKFSDIQKNIILKHLLDKRWRRTVVTCEWMANLSLILTVLVQSEANKNKQIDELIRLKNSGFKEGPINLSAYLFMIQNFPKRLLAAILYRFSLYKLLITLSNERAN